MRFLNTRSFVMLKSFWSLVIGAMVLGAVGFAAKGMNHSRQASCCPTGDCCPNGACCVTEPCCENPTCVPGGECCLSADCCKDCPKGGANCCNGTQPVSAKVNACCAENAPCCEAKAPCCQATQAISTKAKACCAEKAPCCKD